MNIKFEYLYRDAGNYKVYGNIIFRNPENLNIEHITETLNQRLIDGSFFNPQTLLIPALKHSEFNYDSGLDHAWNEFDSIELTKEEPTDPRTISEFLEATSKLR